jgi:hypothetical protein
VAEGARLESVFRGNSNVGSNPTLSASTAAGPSTTLRFAQDFGSGLRRPLNASSSNPTLSAMFNPLDSSSVLDGRRL